jgi:PTS system beta-glucosides-specific IIC component
MNESAKKIIELIGGMDNVVSYTHCATRLRFNLKDSSKAKPDELKAVKEVLGVVESGGIFQIIIGPKVDVMYQEIQKTFGDTSARTEKTGAAEKNDVPKNSILNNILSYISGSITPNMPVMIASGLISAVLAVLTQVGVLTSESSTYVVWSAIADAVFYFLPVLIAVSAARKLNSSPAMAVFVSLATISTTINGVEGLTMFGITIPTVTYSSNIVPVLLMVPILAWLERMMDKYLPKQVSFILKPFICAVIILPITLFILGPIGTLIGTALANVCVWLAGYGGIAYGLIALVAPLLIITGMHTMLIPVIVNEITTIGYSYTFSFNIAVNFAIAGAALAVGFRSKKQEGRSLGFSTGVTALLSVTEPALYGCIIPFKRTIISTCVASGLTGVLVGLLKIKGYAPASVSLLTLPIFMGEDSSNFVKACIAAVVAVVLGFVITALTFKEEETE